MGCTGSTRLTGLLTISHTKVVVVVVEVVEEEEEDEAVFLKKLHHFITSAKHVEHLPAL